MLRGSRELWLALIAILFLTSIYFLALALTDGVPAAGGLYGHAMGILGFLLMLMTEVLYSLRKRSRSARWGRMSAWLEFHIFTGLVGPYLVLLHTSWKFNGVAGVLMLMTVIIVASGFVGRYIYTAVPRTVDGAEVQASELEKQIAGLERELQTLYQSSSSPQTAEPEATLELGTGSGQGVLLAGAKAGPASKEQSRQIKALVKQRARLTRQANSIANARKALATWHTVHIPIGLALFTLAGVHIAAAVYYASLLR
jgi:hypothetical protein